MKKALFMGLTAAALLAFVFAGPAMLSNNNAVAQIITDNSTDDSVIGDEQLGILNGNNTNDTQTAAPNGTQVDIGKGSNATVQYYTFTPNRAEINAGESVTWSTSAQLMDWHTVTFLDPSVRTELILPFGISDEELELMPPFNTGDPFIMDTPDGPVALVANKILFYPSAVDTNNQTSYLNGTEIEYSMAGDEKVVHSGIMQPPFPPSFIAEEEGGGADSNISHTNNNNNNETSSSSAGEMIHPPDSSMNETDVSGAAESEPSGPPFPFVSSFTVTFEEPGTYDYFCAIHPWMTGQVVVNGGGGGDNTTTATSTMSDSTSPDEGGQFGGSNSNNGNDIYDQ